MSPETLSRRIARTPRSRDFEKTIETLAKANLLFQVLEKFKTLDLSPKAVSNADMGLAFEELIRRFAELSNETAGEHFTPREVIKLMGNLLFAPDADALGAKGVIRSLYDPTAGSGGMLTVGEEHLHAMNPGAVLNIFGQELNDESYAICKADMLIKGHDVRHILCGNTLSDDGHRDRRFDYMLSNPPFGVDWKKVEKAVKDERDHLGHNGRFGPGLPRTSDGSLLFLLHLLSKMRPARDGGARIGIVLNGSPLFTGDAGSGESEIRRHVLENDLLEAIVALPTDMFYNTGIATYIWVLCNRKRPERAGKVLLVNASDMGVKMKKSLGSKRKELSDAAVDEITRLAEAFSDKDERCRIVPTETFGYWSVTVERPELDARGKPVKDKKGRIKADSSKRDTETVPFSRVPKFFSSASGLPQGDERPHPAVRADLEKYLADEVLPHAPDAYIDHDKTRVGYEIPFNRFFYRYTPPRPLADIDRDLRASVDKIQKLLSEITR